MSRMGGLVIAALALLCVCAEAQQKVITMSEADLAKAAATTTTNPKHIFRALTEAGLSYRDTSALSRIPPTVLLPPGGNNRFPDDLSYQGGPTVASIQSHAIYIQSSDSTCLTPDCWGNPEDFLTHLGNSSFIHITDQYVGRHGNHRYTNGVNLFLCCGTTGYANAFTDGTMQFAVFIAVALEGLPPGDVYHIFLPPGTDECFDSSATVCYSPDNLDTFFYCGYHSSVDFGYGPVLYSVEPYTNVSHCSVAPGTPNGSLVDSTANVLSHETFETITDPFGTAWWNAFNLGSLGAEIGDECAYGISVNDQGYYNPSVFSISGKQFAVQPEYSNASHSCATNPPGD